MLTVSRTGKINSWLSKWDRWLPAVYFLCVLALYMTMLVKSAFVDELDVFYGGYNILKSGDLYRAYPSQHMPFSYYIAAFGALLGARTVWWFRLYFYCLLSGLWTGTYIRYRKHFPRLALLSMPVFYIAQLGMHSMGTTMISDHWQGIGLIIVLLELVMYADTRKIPVSTCCWISLGIVLSFGTTFLSAYPLAIVFAGVIATQVVMAVRKERKIGEMALEDLRLALICLCPFAILLLWYAVSGNLGNAIGSAYDLNVNVYSKYLGGYGTSPGGTFLAVFPNWFWYQVKGGRYVASGDLRWALQIWLQTAALLVFAVSLFWKDKKRIAAVTFLAAVIVTGVRAFDGFHGAPYMAVTCIPMAFCLDGALSFFIQKRKWIRALPAAAALACALVLVVPAAKEVTSLIYVPGLASEPVYLESNRDILEVLTEPGERIHTGDVSQTATTVMRYNLRLDEAAPAVSNPWFYEYYGERELQTLKDNKTRIVTLEPDGSVWGFTVRDYAPDFVAYVEENYTEISPDVYVRNEDFPAAMAKLRQEGYGVKTVEVPGSAQDLGPMMGNGQVLEQRFVAADKHLTAVQLRAATYFRKNRVGITVQLFDTGTGEKLGESTLPRDQIRDGYYSRFALDAETVPGRNYTIRITTDGALPEGQASRMHLYYHTDAPSDDETSAWIDGVKQGYNWSAAVEYDPE